MADKGSLDSFREALKDVVLVAERLSPHCQSMEEFSGMVSLALENDAQLRLLMSLVTQTKR